MKLGILVRGGSRPARPALSPAQGNRPVAARPRPLFFAPVALVAFAALSASGHLPVRAAATSVVVNEVYYDPLQSTKESAYEWVELMNTGDDAADLVGWQLADGRSADTLPDVSLAPGELLVVAGGPGFAEEHPDFKRRVVLLTSEIGNGLGNSGDQVRLVDGSGTLVDGMSYGDDRGVLDPAPPDVASGHSLERIPAGTDTGTGADWRDQEAPTPGEAAPSAPAPATAVPTPPAGATSAPRPGLSPVVLNEYLPAPKAVDWDGDGTANGNDEWVELYNAGEANLDLRGWQLDDQAGGGSTPFVLPEGSQIGARGFLVLFKRQTKLSLNNDTDSVRLLQPDGAVADETSFTKTAPDGAFARDGDGSGPWTDQLAPSPAQSNGSAGPAGGDHPEPGPSPTPAAGTPAGPTPSPARRSPTASTPKPGSPSPTPRPAASPATPMPHPVGGGTIFLPLVISEVLFDPAAAGNDAADEWVELFNRGSLPVSLDGWSLGDAVDTDTLPAGLAVPPRGFAVITATPRIAAALADAGVTAAGIPDGRLGNGLGNGGDVVRLRGPTGDVADAVSYGDNLMAFDPPVPLGPAGVSIERLPPEADTDTADDWWLQPAPSPGRRGERQRLEGEVRLNEVLPAPRRVDWDSGGSADHTDEWVEMFNASDFAVELTDWQLVSLSPERAAIVGTGYRPPQDAVARTDWSYRWPAGSLIAARSFAVLHRAATRLALPNDGGALLLVRPDTVVADRVIWAKSPGYDHSWSRSEDGVGPWVPDYAVTPGEPNRPLAVPTPADQPVAAPAPTPDAGADLPLVSLAEARRLPRGRRVRVRGWVVAAPGMLGIRDLYLGDGEAGLRLWLGWPEAAGPGLADGLGAGASSLAGGSEGVAGAGRGRLALGSLTRNPLAARPPLTVGAPILAAGVLRDFHGERELVVARPADLDAWNNVGAVTEPSLKPIVSQSPAGTVPALAPLSAATGALTETIEGRLVQLRGRVVSRQGSALMIDDGSGPALVVLPPGRRILLAPVRPGAQLIVRGVVSQYALRAPWRGGYRLRPRGTADVVVIRERPLPQMHD